MQKMASLAQTLTTYKCSRLYMMPDIWTAAPAGGLLHVMYPFEMPRRLVGLNSCRALPLGLTVHMAWQM